MKLHTSVGPNPRVVRMYMLEKGIELPTEEVDIIAGDNRKPDYVSSLNCAGETPVLVTDDGACISESVAICEYLDEADRAPGLIGETATERAQTRAWLRRVEIHITLPLTTAFRATEGRPMFEPRVPVVSSDAGGELKALVRARMAWVDEHMGDGPWLLGDRFSLADIALFSFLDFGRQFGQPYPADLPKLAAWFRSRRRPAERAGRLTLRSPRHPGLVPGSTKRRSLRILITAQRPDQSWTPERVGNDIHDKAERS